MQKSWILGAWCVLSVWECVRVRVCFLGGGGWVLRLGGLGLGCCGEGVAVASCTLGNCFEAGAWGTFFFVGACLFVVALGMAGDLGGATGFRGFAAPSMHVEFHPLRQPPEHLSRKKKGRKLLESELTSRGSDGKTLSGNRPNLGDRQKLHVTPQSNFDPFSIQFQSDFDPILIRFRIRFHDTVRQCIDCPSISADDLARLPIEARGLHLPRLPSLAVIARTAALATMPRASRATTYRQILLKQERAKLFSRLRGFCHTEPSALAGNLDDPPQGLSLRHLSRKLAHSRDSAAVKCSLAQTTSLFKDLPARLRHAWLCNLPGDHPARPATYHGHRDWLHTLPGKW